MKKKYLKKMIVTTILLFSFGYSFSQISFHDVNFTGGDNISKDLSITVGGITNEITISSDGTELLITTTTSGSKILYTSGTNETATGVGLNIAIEASTGTYGDDNYPIQVGSRPSIKSYFGFSVDVGGDIYYGYIKMVEFVFISGSLVWGIENYAYQETANTAILTGDQGSALSIEDENSPKIRVFLNNKNELSIANLSEISTYKIYSITGQAIKEGTIQERSSLINVSSIKNGLYILKVIGNDSGKSLTKKILL